MTDDLTTIETRWAGVALSYTEHADDGYLATTTYAVRVGQPNDDDRAILQLAAHAPADIRALLDALAVCDATLTARSLTVAELLSELALLRELRADVERWRDAGGDIRDLRYVLETLDKLPASVPDVSSERLVTGPGKHETLTEGGTDE